MKHLNAILILGLIILQSCDFEKENRRPLRILISNNRDTVSSGEVGLSRIEVSSYDSLFVDYGGNGGRKIAILPTFIIDGDTVKSDNGVVDYTYRIINLNSDIERVKIDVIMSVYRERKSLIFNDSLIIYVMPD